MTRPRERRTRPGKLAEATPDKSRRPAEAEPAPFSITLRDVEVPPPPAVRDEPVDDGLIRSDPEVQPAPWLGDPEAERAAQRAARRAQVRKERLRDATPEADFSPTVTLNDIVPLVADATPAPPASPMPLASPMPPASPMPSASPPPAASVKPPMAATPVASAMPAARATPPVVAAQRPVAAPPAVAVPRAVTRPPAVAVPRAVAAPPAIAVPPASVVPKASAAQAAPPAAHASKTPQPGSSLPAPAILVLSAGGADPSPLGDQLRAFGFDVRAQRDLPDLPAPWPFVAVFIDHALRPSDGGDAIDLCNDVRERSRLPGVLKPVLVLVAEQLSATDRVRAGLAGCNEILLGAVTRGGVARVLDSRGIALPSDARRT